MERNALMPETASPFKLITADRLIDGSAAAPVERHPQRPVVSSTREAAHRSESTTPNRHFQPEPYRCDQRRRNHGCFISIP